VFRKVEGIVLRTIKYSDYSLIIHLFTLELGRISCIVRKSRNMKAGFANSFFQPFNVIQCELYYKPTKEIHTIKEVHIVNSFSEFSISPEKLAIRMFLSEILNKCIKYQHTDEKLYDFLLSSFKVFSNENIQQANFHIWFLIELSGFLGFYPVGNFSKNVVYFDLLNANFINEPLGTQTLNSEDSKNLYSFITQSNGKWFDIKLNSHQRRSLIEGLLNYYTIHTGSNITSKSMDVFTELFN
jgi:DNA repair protein RecO (recombination protein O)